MERNGKESENFNGGKTDKEKFQFHYVLEFRLTRLWKRIKS